VGWGGKSTEKTGGGAPSGFETASKLVAYGVNLTSERSSVWVAVSGTNDCGESESIGRRRNGIWRGGMRSH